MSFHIISNATQSYALKFDQLKTKHPIGLSGMAVQAGPTAPRSPGSSTGQKGLAQPVLQEPYDLLLS